MENAGQTVAEQVLACKKTVATVLIVAGGGNNGGDGFIAAQMLRNTGIVTTVLCVGSNPKAGTDAQRAKQAYDGELIFLPNKTTPIPAEIQDALKQCDAIIDALFGAGLRKEITGIAARLIKMINQIDRPVISVDLPSGLDGNDNRVKGVAIQADKTVTFFLAKPAHLLFPGRKLCGELVVKQIGLNPSHLLTITPPFVHKNCPSLFTALLPIPELTAHKYQRGHVLVRSGPIYSTGAPRLSASTALICGAGAVSLASSTEALAVNAAHLTAVMLEPCNSLADWEKLLRSKKRNVAVIGPGNGLDEKLKECVLQSFQLPVSLVVDADALSCWQDSPDKFISMVQHAKGQVVITPHDAEFNRLFQSTQIAHLPSKLHKAKAAAKLTRAVVIYKGADTVIAAPGQY